MTQVFIAMPEIMLKLIALVFMGVKCLILNFPSRSPSSHYFINIVIINLDISHSIESQGSAIGPFLRNLKNLLEHLNYPRSAVRR